MAVNHGSEILWLSQNDHSVNMSDTCLALDISIAMHKNIVIPQFYHKIFTSFVLNVSVSHNFKECDRMKMVIISTPLLVKEYLSTYWADIHLIEGKRCLSPVNVLFFFVFTVKHPWANKWQVSQCHHKHPPASRFVTSCTNTEFPIFTVTFSTIPSSPGDVYKTCPQRASDTQ